MNEQQRLRFLQQQEGFALAAARVASERRRLDAEFKEREKRKRDRESHQKQVEEFSRKHSKLR